LPIIQFAQNRIHQQFHLSKRQSWLMTGGGGNEEVSKQLKGLRMKDHPGYLFYAPGNSQ
jgi:hypothetical protein